MKPRRLIQALGSTLLSAAVAYAQCDEDKLLADPGDQSGHAGYSIEAFGDVVLIGGPTSGTEGAVFEWRNHGGTWQKTQVLLGSAGNGDMRFGSSISAAGNWAVIGAPFDTLGIQFSGSAFVFERTPGGWVERQQLIPPVVYGNHNFGSSSSMSGSRAAVGAWSINQNAGQPGTVYVYDLIGGTWTLTGQVANDLAGSDYARGVAIEGDTLFVGAPTDGVGPIRPGRVDVWRESGGSWTRVQQLYPDDVGANGHFGLSIALEGDQALIGAPRDETLGTWGGALYVFEDLGGVWTRTQKLFAPDGGQDDLFAFAVDMDGERAVVSSHFENESATQSGSAYVLAREPNGWRVALELQPADAEADLWFGVSCALSRTNVAIGAQRDDTLGLQAGAAYLFEMGGDDVSGYCTALPNSTGAPALIDWSGYTSVAANAFTLRVVGAPPGKLGLFWYGPQQAQVPFGNGVRCIAGGFYRLNPSIPVTPDGSAARHVDFTVPPASTGPSEIAPGSTWNFQFWYRDPPAGGAGFNLSDGLSATFCP